MNQIKTGLYALNKDKSYQRWAVYVDGNKVIVEFGKVGGKTQVKETTCEPKNVGRANETSAEEQAVLEAISKWEKQVRTGYRETMEELQTEEQFSPMLAQDAIKRSKDIIYPCYVQPKLDGLRCLVTFDEQGQPVFNSRGNKIYPIQGKIVEEMIQLRESTGFDMFDGEVYLHGLSLQKIVSLAKKWRSDDDIYAEMLKDQKKAQKTDPNAAMTHPYGGYTSEDLEFHIFDIPSKEKVWDSNSDNGSWDYNEHPCRYSDLMNADSWVSAMHLNKIKIVHGSFMEDEKQTKDSIGYYMQQGYEGAIIRNFKGMYEFGQRSSQLQKWKLFQDTEAKVVDVEIDKNGEGVLHCVLKNGIKFKCKQKGTHAERKFEEQQKLIGRFVTVSYQALTDDGVLQFPVAHGVREVNPETWEPLE